MESQIDEKIKQLKDYIRSLNIKMGSIESRIDLLELYNRTSNEMDNLVDESEKTSALIKQANDEVEIFMQLQSAYKDLKDRIAKAKTSLEANDAQLDLNLIEKSLKKALDSNEMLYFTSRETR